MTKKSRLSRLMSSSVVVLLCISSQASAGTDFWCETFLERPVEVQQLMLLSWLEGTRVENQYYRLNALTARVEEALTELEPGTPGRYVLTTNVGGAIAHMKKVNSMVMYAQRNKEAFFSKVQEYCARPEIKGATVLEVIPNAIIELINSEAEASQK